MIDRFSSAPGVGPASRIRAGAPQGVLRAALLAFVCAAASPAMAQTVGSTFWQSNGGGCMPTDAAVRSRVYMMSSGGGAVRYRNNNSVAPLIFVCPVSAYSSAAPIGDMRLVLLSEDPDGPGSNYKVQATLKSFRKDSGSYNTNVCQVTSDSVASSSNFEICPLLSTPNAGLDDLYYWVEVVLSRAVPGSLTPVFKGVALVQAFTFN